MIVSSLQFLVVCLFHAETILCGGVRSDHPLHSRVESFLHYSVLGNLAFRQMIIASNINVHGSDRGGGGGFKSI